MLSFDIVSGSDTTPCVKIDKQLVVYLYNNVVCIMKKSQCFYAKNVNSN